MRLNSLEEHLIKNLQPLDIVMFHVGGVSGYGPIDYVINTFPKHSVVVCFEANPSKSDRAVQKEYAMRGVRTILVPKCVGEKEGRQPFYINKHPESSSLFPPAPQALQEHVMYGDINTWSENCELDHMIEVDTITLDILIRDRILPSPDILSLDTQGSELRIMRGAKKCIAETVLCVVSEINFFEIYKGQDIFCYQNEFLSQYGFRLADILNSQYWHPAPAAGLGFLTVGEALFFRQLEKIVSNMHYLDSKNLLYKLIKLAAIAYAFKRLSYVSKIVTLLLEKFGNEARSILLSQESLKPLLETQKYMKRNYGRYMKDNKFFYQSSWREKGAWKAAIQPLAQYGRNAFREVFQSIAWYFRRKK